MHNRLEIHLLGGLQIRHNNQPVTELVSRKAEALLAYLACNQRPYPRDVLADFLWAERSQTGAAGNLRVLLNSLRNTVNPFVLITRHTVAINLQSDLWVDTLAFERLLADFGYSSQAKGELPVRITEQIEQALTLYRGEFLTGFFIRDAPEFEVWARIERERLHILAINAVQALSLHYLTTRQYALGSNAVERWLHWDLLNEEAHRTLMLLLAQDGHRLAALQHYERIVDLFQHELGTDPSLETEALYHQILDDAIAPVPRESLVLNVPLSPDIPNNLEAALSPIVGRERELVQILDRLQQPPCRLLTLVGIGGVGKTRLALEAALHLSQLDASQSLFADGIFWVRLEHVETDALLLSAIAQAVQYSFQGVAEPAKQLLEFLRHRRLLLILDNVEQLVGQGDLLLQILQSAPGVKLLVTSREWLNFQGEWLVEVNGLPYPLTFDQETWSSYPAAQLFVQCATAMVADFDPQAQQTDIIQICGIIEGLPLGIQLAAASVRTFTCAQIVAAIQHNLDFLSSTMRNLPVRHRSLRAIFEHSWLLLSAVEKHAFQQLAIFAGGFTAKAAAEVAEIPATVLQNLIDKSLVHVQASEEIMARDTAELRYGMHPVLHQYAAEKLAAAWEAESKLASKHARYYSQLVASQASLLPTAQAAQAITLIGWEIENVRKSWQTAVTWRLLPILRLYLPTLVQYYRLRGLFQEGQALIAAALDTMGRDNEDAQQVNTAAPLLLGHLFAYQAELLNDSGHYEEASIAANSALRLPQTRQDAIGQALSYLQWGIALYQQADYAASDRKLLQALQIATEAKATQIQADVHLSIARNRFYQGNYAEGQIRHEQAIAIYRANGDLVNELAAYNSLARLSLFAGDYAKAQLYYERCLHEYRLIGNRPAIGLTLNNLGALANQLGNYPAAQKYFEESLLLRRMVGGRQSEALILANLALTCHQSHNNEQAVVYGQQALKLSIELGERDTEAYARLCLGHALAALGHWEEAIATYQRCLAGRRQAGQHTQALEPLAGLAQIALTRGNLVQAKAYTDDITPHLGPQTYAGIVELIRVYLTCYRVLYALQDPQAVSVLELGYSILQARADKINDEKLRRGYLQIAAHAELGVAYAQQRLPV